MLDRALIVKKIAEEKLTQTTAVLKQKRTAEEFININKRIKEIHSESNALRGVAVAPSPFEMGVSQFVADEDELPVDAHDAMMEEQIEVGIGGVALSGRDA